MAFIAERLGWPQTKSDQESVDNKGMHCHSERKIQTRTKDMHSVCESEILSSHKREPSRFVLVWADVQIQNTERQQRPKTTLRFPAVTLRE